MRLLLRKTCLLTLILLSGTYVSHQADVPSTNQPQAHSSQQSQEANDKAWSEQRDSSTPTSKQSTQTTDDAQLNIATTSKQKVVVPVKSSSAQQEPKQLKPEKPVDYSHQEDRQPISGSVTTETPNLNDPPQRPSGSQAPVHAAPMPSVQATATPTKSPTTTASPLSTHDDLPEPPSFFEAAELHRLPVKSFDRVLEPGTKEEIRNSESHRRIYHVKYQPDGQGRSRVEVWLQEFNKETRQWTVRHDSTHYEQTASPVPPQNDMQERQQQQQPPPANHQQQQPPDHQQTQHQQQQPPDHQQQQPPDHQQTQHQQQEHRQTTQPSQQGTADLDVADGDGIDGLIAADFTNHGSDTLSVSTAAAEDQTLEQQEATSMYNEGMKLMESQRLSDYKRAYQLFNSAALLNKTEARELVAFSYMYGDYLTQNLSKAHEMFEQLSAEGNPRGQLGLGIMSASGIHVNSSQARALVYLTFSALGGDELAQMIMGYRHLSGIGVPNNCETALIYYSKVARSVASRVSMSGGPVQQRVRLMDEADVTSGSNPNVLDDDLIQYYKFLADKGDVNAQVGLGQLYLQGSRGVPVDYAEAFHYFSLASQAGNANADAFLGRMYAEGLGDIEQDYSLAYDYFTKSAQQGSPVGQSGLGLLFLKGNAVPKDANQAFQYFQKSADQGWVDGQLQLGLMYYSGQGTRRDYKAALKYFNLASQSGNVLAYYNLAQMHATGTGVMRACHTAVAFFKNVAERGSWAKLLMEAYESYQRGYVDTAMLKYLVAGELGYEVAQSNVGYLLDSGQTDAFKDKEKYRRALLQWNRAAGQGSVPARIKLGDYHYYGLGTEVDYEQAIQHYRVAGEQQNNAQAMYNLGYMHEAGLGLKQDLHLAKRFYDMAADSSKDAYVPVTLALFRLNILTNLDYLSNTSNLWRMASVLHPQSYLGPSWDMYMITFLGVLLGILFVLRTQIILPG